MRRAEFGVTLDELETYAPSGYEATVEDLPSPSDSQVMPSDVIRRYRP